MTTDGKPEGGVMKNADGTSMASMPRPSLREGLERRRRILERLYPEAVAGGFSRNDQRVIFYTRVNAFIEPSMTVLDFGAGRGRHAERESGFVRALTRLKGKVAKVIGVDVDPAVAG